MFILHIKKDDSFFSDTKKRIEFKTHEELMKYVKRYRIKYYSTTVISGR